MIIDPRVPKTDSACPARGRITKGFIKKKGALEIGYADYQTHFAPESVDNPIKCMKYADSMLKWWNETGYLVNDHNSGAYGTFNELQRQWYWLMKGISNQETGGSVNKKLESVYWSWYNDVFDNPFQRGCSIDFTCSGSTGEADNGFSGYVDDRGVEWTYCTIPTINDHCLKNAITLVKPKECTGLTQDGGVGIDCMDWYDLHVEDNEKETLVNNICTWYPWLSECTCLNRHLDPKYLMMEKVVPVGISDGCWWAACKKEGNDRLVGPVMSDKRHDCKVEFCGNLIQGIGGGSYTIEDIEQNTNCSVNTSGGGGGSSNDDVVVDDSGTGVPVVGGGAGGDSSSMKNTVFIVVGAVFLLIIVVAIIVAMRMSASSSNVKAKHK